MNVLEYIVIQQKNITGISFISLYLFIFFIQRRIIWPTGLPKGIEDTMWKYFFWAVFICSALVRAGIEGLEATMHISPLAGCVSLAVTACFAITVFRSVVRIATFQPGSLRHTKTVMLVAPFMDQAIIGAACAVVYLSSPEGPLAAAMIQEDPLIFIGYAVVAWPWALYFHFSKKARAVWG